MELVKETFPKLKSLPESDRGANVDPTRRIQDAKLAIDFQTTLQEFQKVQQLASECESTFSPAVPPLSSPTIQEVLLLGNEIVFNEAIIEEREQGIKKI
ncbi:hypothetical protein Pfo_029190 [Paulownia fortunei]|nr:hypothetical protein Pfo_029190 [Paulownia fortunei]